MLQLFARDHLAGPFHQRLQYLQRLSLKPQLHAALPQLACARVELEDAEPQQPARTACAVASQHGHSQDSQDRERASTYHCEGKVTSLRCHDFRPWAYAIREVGAADEGLAILERLSLAETAGLSLREGGDTLDEFFRQFQTGLCWLGESS